MRSETTLNNLFQGLGLHDAEAQRVALELLGAAGIREVRPGRIAQSDRAAAISTLRGGLIRACADPGCVAAPIPAGRRRIAAAITECELCLGGSSRRAVEILTALSVHAVPTLDLDEPALLATVAAELGGEELALGELARRLRAHGVDMRAAGLRGLAERSGAFRVRGERIRRDDEVGLAEALERLAATKRRAPLDVVEPALPAAADSDAEDGVLTVLVETLTTDAHETNGVDEADEIDPDTASADQSAAPMAAPPITSPTTPAVRAASSAVPQSIQGLENERIGRFAALFGSIEAAIRERYALSDELRLGDLVRTAAERDPLVRSWSAVLLDAVRFRNPLMHRSVRGRPLAVPTEEFLAELALAARSLTGEARLIDLVERPWRIEAEAAPAEIAARLALGRPALIEADGEECLVTPASFARWAAAESLAHPGRPLLYGVSRALELARLAAARCVEVDVTARPAALLLALRAEPSPDAAVLRRRETGSPIVGVALPIDLPRLLQAIDDDPVGPLRPFAVDDDEDER